MPIYDVEQLDQYGNKSVTCGVPYQAAVHVNDHIADPFGSQAEFIVVKVLHRANGQSPLITAQGSP